MNDTTAPAVLAWADADLVPISALQHYAYCPRQCALIHVEQAWTENVYTLRGRRAHERVHAPGAALRDGTRTERALPLFSDRLGLVGVADVVEFGPDGTPFPVEHKVGSRKARLADEVQLAAQALCLEDMTGRDVPAGALYYARTRRRRDVAITPDLRAAVERITAEVRAMLHAAVLPPPVHDARCPTCSLLETCMPGVVARWNTPDDPDDDA